MTWHSCGSHSGDNLSDPEMTSEEFIHLKCTIKERNVTTGGHTDIAQLNGPMLPRSSLNPKTTHAHFVDNECMRALVICSVSIRWEESLPLVLDHDGLGVSSTKLSLPEYTYF